MNEQDRQELQSLKERHTELFRQLSGLADKFKAGEEVLQRTQQELQELRHAQSTLESARMALKAEMMRFENRVATEAAPQSSAELSTGGARAIETAVVSHAKPPPVPMNAPPVIPAAAPITPITPAPTPAVTHPSAGAIAEATAQRVRAEQVTPLVAAQPISTTPSTPLRPLTQPFARTESTPHPALSSLEEERESAPAPKGSFELRLGTYWFVRIGIVMLLTGVVFLGTYAYKNFIGKLGAGGKVTLLYMVSGLLLGVGAWLYRKQETLKNYAQVLFAGGLAAVYFTTYAAHHIPTLQIIQSAVVDGVLLLGWAAFVVWLADRQKSEVLALFAVGLAFYSSVMTQVGLFTLYSNLILTVAAVFFLVRNRWATLTFATLTASYGGYAFWRFYHGGEWHWAGPEEGLWKGCYFLISYWVLFTAAVFTSRSESFRSKNRSTFLSLNNASFFTLFILTMLQVRHGGFWKFALIYGSVLLGLAALARWKLSEDKLCRNAYLTQGLVLVTVGFITYFAGLKLALVLATESVLLTLANRYTLNRVLQVGAYITALLAVGYALRQMTALVRADLIIGSFIGAAMIFNAAFSRGKEKSENDQLFSMIWFSCLGLIIWFVTTWQQTEGQWRGLTLALESLAFVIASQPLRNFVLRHGALPYAAVAVGWAIYTMDGSERMGLYVGLGIGAVVLLDDLLAPDEEGEPAHSKTKALFTLLALVMWFVTTYVFAPPAHLAPVLAAEGLLFVAAYRLIPSKGLSYGGLLFVFLAQLACLFNLIPKEATTFAPAWLTVRLPWWNPVVVAGISLALAHWARRPQRLLTTTQETFAMQFAYVLPMLGILFCGLHPHFATGTWLGMTALLAVVVTLYGLFTRLWLLAAAAQVYLLYSVLQFLRLAVLGPASLKPDWYWALTPMLALVGLSIIAIQRHRISDKPDAEQWLIPTSLVYRIIAVAISVPWVFRYVSSDNYAWAFALLGAVCFAALAIKRSQELLVISGVYSGLAVLVLWSWIGDDALTHWPNLLVIIGLLAQGVVAQKWSMRFPVAKPAHVTATIIGLATLWLWVSKWIISEPGSFYLTAGWAGLSFLIFAAGFILKDKVYRWSGLAVLGAAIIRVGVVDIWRLGTIYRILSFMALGVVLLVVGLIYTKYQEKIRQWL